MRIDLPHSPRQEALTIMEGDDVRDNVGMAITDTVTEVLVPFADLGVSPGDTIRFKVVVTSNGDAVESIPETGTIPLTVPSADFEKSLWRV